MNMKEIITKVKKQNNIEKLVFFYNTALGDLGQFTRICNSEWELDEDLAELGENIADYRNNNTIHNYYICTTGIVHLTDDLTIAFIKDAVNEESLREAVDSTYDGLNWLNEVYYDSFIGDW